MSVEMGITPLNPILGVGCNETATLSNDPFRFGTLRPLNSLLTQACYGNWKVRKTVKNFNFY